MFIKRLIYRIQQNKKQKKENNTKIFALFPLVYLTYIFVFTN